MDNLGTLLRQQRTRPGLAVHIRQGKIVEWSPSTSTWRVSVDGEPLDDLPVLQPITPGESLDPDTAIVLIATPQGMAVLGRLVPAS